MPVSRSDWNHFWYPTKTLIELIDTQTHVCYSDGMQFTTQLIRMTESVHADFVRNIWAMPEDKLNWSVLDAGRTPLSLFQEVANAPTYALPMLATRACPPFDPAMMEAIMAEQAKLDTLDKCEEAMKENLQKLYEAIRTFPESDLEIEIDLPFAEGMRQSMADIMGYPYWNTSYHLGQIGFIQTLYGYHANR
jgi:hypothetical protein